MNKSNNITPVEKLLLWGLAALLPFIVSFTNEIAKLSSNSIAIPTLTSFTDNDTDNQLQSASEVVFTAVFQNSVTISPTIEIPGAVIGGEMISSDRLTWYYTWNISDSGASDGSYSASLQVTDPDNMATSSVGSSIDFTLDSTVPTVVLTDTDSDDRLTIYDNIRITATFSEPMANSPLINIVRGSTTVTLTALTQSTASIWYYDWALTTPSTGIPEVGFYTVTVSGTSAAGKVYPNADIDNILFELLDDSDGDQLADGGADKDDDNDGILDSREGNGDIDGDGFPNRLDRDSDGDGCPDTIENNYSDPDIDGVVGTSPVQTDDDGKVTTDANNNTFSHGIVIYRNTFSDADNNNVFDYLEPPIISLTSDTATKTVRDDGSLTLTVTATTSNGSFSYQWQYKTSSSEANWMDLANTDFFANNVNTRILSITASASINLYVFRAVVTPSCGAIQYSSVTELDVFIDTDNDGLRNSIDPDDDNDGVNDVDEIGNCADGTNNTDPLVVDTDGDGYNDLIDVFPCDNSEWEDCEGDGQGDNSDTDDDNDGVSDTLDPFPCDASESADFDADGVGDNTDIDDDNDGILDVYEDTAAGDDDIDNDGIVNSKDLDSDGDGCYDVTEAGLSDPDNNGVLGNGAVAVDTQGRVNTDSISTTFTVGNNAYLSATNSASILDLDSNNTKDFLELPTINISGQPQSISVAQNTGSSFTVTSTSAVTSLSFQWQYATPNFPSSWADISDSGSYSGSSSSTLSISPTLISFDGYQYRVLITNSCGAYTVTSTQATLTVEIDTDGDGDPDSTDL
ncbi:MAG: hypothetical protein ACPH4N_07650, partial [Flavobacteriaceae bacterium]